MAYIGVGWNRLTGFLSECGFAFYSDLKFANFARYFTVALEGSILLLLIRYFQYFYMSDVGVVKP